MRTEVQPSKETKVHVGRLNTRGYIVVVCEPSEECDACQPLCEVMSNDSSLA